MHITVYGNPISKKNSQRILRLGNGRTIIAPSEQYKKYEAYCQKTITKPDEPIDYNVEVKCLFYMETKRKCDLTNLLEAIDDIMVKCGVLADDNFTIIESHDGSRVLYDKENPRTEVEITRLDNGNKHS